MNYGLWFYLSELWKTTYISKVLQDQKFKTRHIMFVSERGIDETSVRMEAADVAVPAHTEIIQKYLQVLIPSLFISFQRYIQ